MPTEAEFKEQCRAVKDCHTAELLAFGVNYPNPGEFVPEDKRIKLNCGKSISLLTVLHEDCKSKKESSTNP